ncbi:hypothetical protein [Paenibacillus macerans]|uniref:hypothetical protein n=1 Tax=Paenibacillus macerans TaxID=44252 RepID=UPI003D31D50E
MLTFEQKLGILESFPELERKNVSLGRINFHYEGSAYEKKTVVYHLHPGGNGFVYAGLLQGYDADDKGFVNIRDLDEKELRSLVRQSIDSLSVRDGGLPGTLSATAPGSPGRSEGTAESEASASRSSSPGGLWTNAKGEKLTLKYEDDLWYIYSGLSLEMAFETREEAGEYLQEEGFAPQKG